MALIGLIIITALLIVLIVLAVPRIWRTLSVPTASHRAGSVTAAEQQRDSMDAFTSRDLEAAHWLALARLDDDGAPAATWPQAGDSHEHDAIRPGRTGQVAASQAETAANASRGVADQVPARLGAG
jgi:hypothetical protein